MPLAENHVALILVPKPNEAGLHPLVEVRSEDNRVELHFLNGRVYDLDPRIDKRGWRIASAYTQRYGGQITALRKWWIRSHSPDAGLDSGAFASKGYGFALYAGLALNTASSELAGIWSPDGTKGRSSEANAMWRNLVKLGVAEEAEAEDPNPGSTSFRVEACGAIDEDKRFVEAPDGREAYITEDEVCGSVDAEVQDDPYITVQILGPNHLLPNGYIVHWRDRGGYLKSAGDVAETWAVKGHVLVRADLGPSATTDDFRMFAGYIEERLPGTRGKELAAQFLKRPDVAARLAKRGRRGAATARPMAGLSGLAFGARGARGHAPTSQAFGALDAQDFPAAPLPPLTAAERADDRKWAALDY